MLFSKKGAIVGTAKIMRSALSLALRRGLSLISTGDQNVDSVDVLHGIYVSG